MKLQKEIEESLAKAKKQPYIPKRYGPHNIGEWLAEERLKSEEGWLELLRRERETWPYY